MNFFVTLSLVIGLTIVKETLSQPAARSLFAYQVSLQRLTRWNQWKHYCGGAVLSTRRIVTAAHCIAGFNVSEIRAVAGESDLLVDEGREQVREIKAAIHHPEWNPETIDWDYALVTLSAPLIFNDFVHSVSLPVIDANEGTSANALAEPLTKVCISAGWKKIRAGKLSNIIQRNDHTVMDFATCQRQYSSIQWYITDRVLCAMPEVTEQPVCNGFSGSPLVCPSSKGNYLAGIASFTMMPCGQTRFPNGFANIEAVVPWLLAN